LTATNINLDPAKKIIAKANGKKPETRFIFQKDNCITLFNFVSHKCIHHLNNNHSKLYGNSLELQGTEKMTIWNTEIKKGVLKIKYNRESRFIKQ